MIRRPPRSTHCISSAASDVYKRQTLIDTKTVKDYKIDNQQTIIVNSCDELKEEAKSTSGPGSIGTSNDSPPINLDHLISQVSQVLGDQYNNEFIKFVLQKKNWQVEETIISISDSEMGPDLNNEYQRQVAIPSSSLVQQKSDIEDAKENENCEPISARIANSQENFETFFNILNLQIPHLSTSIWNLLQLLPINQKVYDYIYGLFKGQTFVKWDGIIYSKNLYQLLYYLQIIKQIITCEQLNIMQNGHMVLSQEDLLKAYKTRCSWRKNFVKQGGLLQIQQLLQNFNGQQLIAQSSSQDNSLQGESQQNPYQIALISYLDIIQTFIYPLIYKISLLSASSEQVAQYFNIINHYNDSATMKTFDSDNGLGTDNEVKNQPRKQPENPPPADSDAANQAKQAANNGTSTNNAGSNQSNQNGANNNPSGNCQTQKNSIGNRFKEIYLYLSNIDIECEKPLHTLQTVVETDRKHIMESIKLQIFIEKNYKDLIKQVDFQKILQKLIQIINLLSENFKEQQQQQYQQQQQQQQLQQQQQQSQKEEEDRSINQNNDQSHNAQKQQSTSQQQPQQQKQQNQSTISQLMCICLQFVGAIFIIYPELLKSYFEDPSLIEQLKNILMNCDDSNIRHCTRYLLMSLNKFVNEEKGLKNQLAPIVMRLNEFQISQLLPILLQPNLQMKYEDFYICFNQIMKKVDLQYLKNQYKINEIIPKLLQIIRERPIFEDRSSNNEDTALQGQLLLLKSLFQLEPELKQQFSEKENIIKEIQDWLFFDPVSLDS
eukprot:TRINITY_DN1923_c0_g1_i3.p1 TRINITY_DN1923_c0_g1~~TRINITY_DN1923_c0_g1_i3.p1  ORF type:complete len:775 (-),score=130.07 TRINITY_DN1923_c0_g1_i3:2202-4526(-)